MQRDVVMSECGLYRYRLGRVWSDAQHLLFVMLNPSTADGEVDDPTVRRCIGFAKSHGYGGIQVVNLYAYRATDPRDLKAAGYPVGADNNDHIKTALQSAGTVCVAWGDRARGLSRPEEVLGIIARAGRSANCLGITKHGLPSHPLMLASACRLQPFKAR